MHLKSLTMKGFKSFASATTLRFEPGITAVVGPNGSGKSNVVDAIAWVLGEQGAKALRGGKMEDVIFAGTADRPPLGRAEVTLTIDNSDGALPIDYAEVSITRRMFRDGVGEYEINGSSCRLLDIQELLSDSGIGREMHVIVGQGQLDAVLSARPEDRRAFVEEAAGVLKHRKRREKTVRKLDAMQANLNRLTDLTGEIRRQLGPLGRQAAVARRAAGVQADLRDAKMRLLADELAQIPPRSSRTRWTSRPRSSTATGCRHALATASAEQRNGRGGPAGGDPGGAAGPGHLVRAVRAGRADARHHRAGRRAGPEPGRAGPGRREPAGTPTSSRPRAARAEAEQEALQETVEAAADELAAATRRTHRMRTGTARRRAELVAANRLIADRREGLARLAGQVHAARSRLSAGNDEVTRLAGAVSEARERAAAAAGRLRRARRTRSVTSTPPRSAWTRRTRRPPPQPRPPRRPGRGADRRAAHRADRGVDPAGQGGRAVARPGPAGRHRRRCWRPATSCRACSAASPTPWTSPPASRQRSPPRSGAIAEAVAVSSVPTPRRRWSCCAATTVAAPAC